MSFEKLYYGSVKTGLKFVVVALFFPTLLGLIVFFSRIKGRLDIDDRFHQFIIVLGGFGLFAALLSFIVIFYKNRMHHDPVLTLDNLELTCSNFLTGPKTQISWNNVKALRHAFIVKGQTSFVVVHLHDPNEAITRSASKDCKKIEKLRSLWGGGLPFSAAFLIDTTFDELLADFKAASGRNIAISESFESVQAYRAFADHLEKKAFDQNIQDEDIDEDTLEAARLAAHSVQATYTVNGFLIGLVIVALILIYTTFIS